jgi:hypothetical protein
MIKLHLRLTCTLLYICLYLLGHGSASTRRYLCRGQELGGRAHLRPDQGWKDIGKRFPGFTGSMVSWFHGSMVPWFHGFMVPWLQGCHVFMVEDSCFHGSRVPWLVPRFYGVLLFYGSMVLRFRNSPVPIGPIVLWFHGSKVPWFHGSMFPWVNGCVVHCYISS